MYCLANFCCICFIRGIEKKLSNIHEAKSNENSYFYKLRTCIPAMDCIGERNDVWLCRSCGEKIDEMYSFYTTCLESRRIFMSYIDLLNPIGNMSTNESAFVKLIDYRKYNSDVIVDEERWTETQPEDVLIKEEVDIECEFEMFTEDNMDDDEYIDYKSLKLDTKRNGLDEALSSQNTGTNETSFHDFLYERSHLREVLIQNLPDSTTTNLPPYPIFPPLPYPIEPQSDDAAPTNTSDSSEKRLNGNKLHYCNICYKSFTRAHVRNLHRRIHLEVNPYKCEVCNKSFSLPSNLKVHQLIHTGVKPYKCDLCDKSFTLISKLNVHKRFHEESKPYSCDICGKKFTHMCFLNSHKRIHSDEKPYTCYICLKSFTRNYSLKEHQRTHFGDKPYKCTQCDCSYSSSSNLIHHTRKHHKGQ